MRNAIATMAACAVLSLGATEAAEAAGAPPAYVAAALADTSRPETDRSRDESRKAAEVVAFTGLAPGGRAADVFPGGGYYTRIFSKVVGGAGHVYAVVPSEAMEAEKPRDPLAPMTALAAEPAYANVSTLVQSMKRFDPPQKLDLVFVSQFYHDMHNPAFGGPDIASVNKAVFAALKPGGIYLVIDHSAPGTGLAATNTLHRIDMEAVKAEVTAAGFVLDGSSDVLKNPDDPHTAMVFAPSIRGKTDQFMLKFKKPR